MPTCTRPKHTVNSYLIPIFILLTLVGCSTFTAKRLYEISEASITLEKPVNWDIVYSERNGTIYLEAANGFGDKNTTRIQIHSSACRNHPENFKEPFNNSVEEVEWNIQRIQLFYDQTPITLIQEPFVEKTGDYEVTKAIIDLPEVPMEEDSDRISTRKDNLKPSQTVHLFQISDGDGNSAMAYIYQSNSDELNAQAQDIVDSIRFDCSIGP